VVLVAKVAPTAALIALLTSGCDSILGLNATIPTDAFSPNPPGCRHDHDEDGDGIDDCDDNCPGIPNPGQEDTLELLNGQPADHVGDACDPSPGKTGDVRTRFLSFSDPNDGLEWQVASGSWIVSNDAYVLTGDTTGNLAVSTFGLQRSAAPFAIQLRVELTTIIAPTTGIFGLTLDVGANDKCEILSGAQEILVAFNQDQQSYFPPAGSFQQGAALTLRADLRDNAVTCSVDNTIAGNNPGPMPAASGTFNLFGQDGTFRITYLEIYDLSGEPP
jgi:hypothetical protein